MRIFSLTRAKRYGIAIAGVVITAFFRLLVDPFFGEEVPLLFFIFPILLSAWYGGLGPGLLATALSLLIGDYLFISPRYSTLRYESLLEMTRFIAVGLIGVIVSLMTQKLRNSIKTQMGCLENFRHLVNGVKDYAIYMLDPQGRVASWSPGAEMIKGYRENEILSRDFSIFFTPEDIESGEPQRGLETAAAEGCYEEEGWRVRKDGSRYWATDLTTALRDDEGRLRGFAKVVRDMTERKLAETALRESQEFTQRVIEVSPSVIYIYDLMRQEEVFINCEVTSVLGYDPRQERQEGKAIDFVRAVMHPDDQWRLLEHLNRVADLNDEETVEFESRVRNWNGEWRWFHSRDKVFSRNKDGSVHEIIGTATDITRRKLEEEKALFFSELNQALRPLTDPEEIKAVAAQIMGEHLGVDRCAYAEIEENEEYLNITSDYSRGDIPSVVGRFSVDDLGCEALSLMRADRPYAADDIEAEASAKKDLSAYRQAEIRALMCVPLRKSGRYVARMAVSQKTPRRWSPHEIELVAKVAERCWESVARARAVRSLRESEERYRAFIANSSEAIWRFELEQPIPINLTEDEQIEMMYKYAYLAECNDAMARMYGYESADQIVGARVGDLLARSDPQNIAILREFKRAGYRLTDAEAREVDRYGNTKYFLINHIGIVEDNAVVRSWGIQRDITKIKRAEQSLRESEERFEKAFRASPDGLIITRQSDGAILEVNDSWRRMLGYGSKEVIGKIWTQFRFPVDPEYRRRARAIMKEQGYIRDFEMGVKRKSGEPLTVRISIEPIELRGERCLVTIVHDVTRRKQAEEALRESEEQARRQLAYVESIYATAPVGLCFVDTDLRYLSINERLAEINGKSVKEHLGRTVREVLSEVLPDAAETVEPIYRRVIETGEPVSNVEICEKAATGADAARHFIASYYPIKNGGGRVLGVNAVVVEITERKKIEEELERLLRQEMAAREDAEAANRMKDEFLATISHELRTPLTSILGWARMLTGGGLTTPQARHALEVIAQSAQSQTQLIEDILDTSRIITGRLKLDARPVAVEHVFHAAVDVIRPSAEAKGIVLSEVVDAPDIVVLGDASRLQQAIWNLLSNAVKFTSAGGRIEARLGRAEGRVEIAVEDTGIGIDPKFLPHVFDRFRQADASSTRKYGGLGIGLAIVRHIVEMHGGGVSASSPGKDQGATFKIRLPLISARRPAQPEAPRLEATTATKEPKILEESHRLDGVRVLVVDDDLNTLELLKFIFEESGAEVITATTADEAMEALDRFKPDALVSDIAMPERDGYDLIREIRSREPERGGKIPAVAVTAYARSEDRMRILAAGFQMHITKPIAPDELITVVASLTGQIHY